MGNFGKIFVKQSVKNRNLADEPNREDSVVKCPEVHGVLGNMPDSKGKHYPRNHNENNCGDVVPKRGFVGFGVFHTF